MGVPPPPPPPGVRDLCIDTSKITNINSHDTFRLVCVTDKNLLREVCCALFVVNCCLTNTLFARFLGVTFPEEHVILSRVVGGTSEHVVFNHIFRFSRVNNGDVLENCDHCCAKSR